MNEQQTKENIQKILAVLEEQYNNAHIALNYSNEWELYVAVVLSAQCTDIRVNIVTEKLFKKYKTLDDYVCADKEEFEKDIKPTGFFRNKAKNILSAAKLVKEKFHGTIPKTMDEILTLPGVARKTANVVLGNAYGVVEGIAVDTHVLRNSQRLRIVDLTKIGGKKKVFVDENEHQIDYIKNADPVKIEQELMKVLPKDTWFSYTYYIIDHGRAVCKARNPQCTLCVLKELCPVSRV